MSTALDDFLATVRELEKIVQTLGAAPLVPGSSRGANILQLSGLQVVAFSALEDFLRRRTLEVISSLGRDGFTFDELPEKLRLFVLEGTIAGVSHVLGKTEADDRITLLQLEGLLLGATSDEAKTFIPSEFFFGRSQSNLSTSNIKSLLEALNVNGGWACLTDIAAIAGFAHLGPPDQIFTRVAGNRHRAAHSFGAEYKVAEFTADIKTSIRVLAFAFDTCINQVTYKLKESKIRNLEYTAFNSIALMLRVFRFNPIAKNWQVTRGKTVKRIQKGQTEKYLNDYVEVSKKSGETLLVLDSLGSPEKWIQPSDWSLS